MPSVEFDSWWKLSPDPKLPHLLPKQHSACYPTVTGPLLWGSQSPCFSGFPEAGKQDPNIIDCTGDISALAPLLGTWWGSLVASLESYQIRFPNDLPFRI